MTPTSSIVMQQLAHLLGQCDAYARDHQRSIACLNAAANIAEQLYITRTACQQTTTTTLGTRPNNTLLAQTSSSIDTAQSLLLDQINTLETLVGRQMIELEQTISELRRIGRQQSQQIATMQQIQINTQNWSIVATEHISSNGNISGATAPPQPPPQRSGQLGGKIGKQKEKVIVEEEERELVGIVSVRPKVARKWINNIVNGYMHEHRWQQQLLSPVVPYKQVSSTKSPVTAKNNNNNNNNSGNDIYFINWEDAASIRRCAERWAALTAVELVIEEKIQDHLRIYRLWKTSQAIMNA